MYLDFWWFVTSAALLLATLVVKMFSVSYLTKLRRELHLIEQMKHHKLKELHREKSKKNIVNANLMVIKKKRDGLRKRILGTEKELEKIAKDIEIREERRPSNKVEK
jgi:hypothetical protein